MKTCCDRGLRLDLGSVCPLCGCVVGGGNPDFVAESRVVCSGARLRYAVPVGFRFRSEYDPLVSGIAEQNVRKTQRDHGTFRTRPSRRRMTATSGPKGRQRRRGLVSV